MATSLSQILAASVLAAGVSAGCIEEDCIETYFLDTPQVAVEDNLGRRVDSINLEFRTDQRVYVPPEHRGIPVGTNLSIYCAPVGRYGNIASSWCVDGQKFEFFISFIDSEGNVKLIVPENQAALRSFNQEDIKITGTPDLKVKCIVHTPRCSTAGFPYIDEYGRERFKETAWKPRTLVGIAEADIITEMLCPAPLPYARPVDESEWRPSSEDEP